METVCNDPYELKFWTKLFDSIYENPGSIDTWDHQWKYACWSQNGLAIEPRVNLVANLGLGRSDATHTTGQNPLLAEISKTQEMMEIKHPPFVVRHRDADTYIFDYIIGGKKMKKYALVRKLLRRLSKNQKNTKDRFTHDQYGK